MSFIPYQVDYSVKNTAKTFGGSKKRITFKFGIANNKAIEDGLSGSNCRGSEHEVVFIWSLASGKRHVIADGKDVHFSETGQNGWTTDRVFQHRFTMNVPGTGTIRCHLISQPVNREIPGASRPFDLRVDGCSFFRFNHIYQLGTADMMVRGRGKYAGDGAAEVIISPEERRQIAAAKLESLKDLREKQDQRMQATGTLPAPSAGENESLISFDDAPPVQQVTSRPDPHHMSGLSLDPSIQSGYSQPLPQQQQQLGFAQPPQQQQQPYSNYGLPQQQPSPPQQQQPYSNYGFAQPPAQQPFGAAPASSALTPYQPTASAPADFFGSPPAASPNPFGASNSQASSYAPSYSAPAPAPNQQYYDPTTGGQMNFAVPPPPTIEQTQQAFGYNPAPAGGFAGLTSPTGTEVSYGSAPSFAQPPQHQYQQQPPQGQQGYPGTATY